MVYPIDTYCLPNQKKSPLSLLFVGLVRERLMRSLDT